MPKTIEDQIKSVDRELCLRKVLYPKRVATGQMKAEQAKHEIACMEAVRETLEEAKRQPKLL